MYVSEAAPSDMRGMLVTFINVNIAGGLFVSSLVDGAFSTVPQGWRYMLGLAALPATIQFIGFLFLPESPRWLVEKVRIDQATQVLIRIRGTTDVKEEIEEIVKAIEEEKGINPLLVRKDGQNGERTCSGTRSTSRGSKAENETFLGSLTYLYDQLWCVTTTRRALILGCALQASQQLAG